MPRETVHPRSHGTDDTPLPQVTVGWSREPGHVQLGVAPPLESADYPPADAEALSIVDAIRADLEFVDKHRNGEPRWSGDTDYARRLESVLLVFERGWFADLDRSGLNRLIVLCRRARDAAFGKDA